MEEHKHIEEAIVEHRMRLENGVKAFSELKEEQKALKPKPLNWITVTFSAIGVLITVLSSWWALSTKFAERPTISDVKEIVQSHSQIHGHPGTIEELKANREEQQEQRRTLDRIETRQDQTSKDVAEIKTDLKAIRRIR